MSDASSLESAVELAFLADGVITALRATAPFSERERDILDDARSFLGTALDGGQTLTSRDFRAATATKFEAFEWTALACLGTPGKDAADSSAEMSKLVQGLVETLEEFQSGEEVEQRRLESAGNFFVALRDVVLASRRRVPQEPQVRSA